MTTNFDRCNAQGKKYERLSTRIFENKQSVIAEGYFPDWDVKLTCDGDDGDYEVTLECKSDTYAKRTGCLAIEFEHNNRPSGIATTKADYWVHYVVDTNRYFLIPIEVLRGLIAEGKWLNRVRGGDDRKSFLYIVDQDHLLEYQDVYDERERLAIWAA